MNQIIVIRAILDADEDVIRDVAIAGNSTLYDLHKLLVDAFELSIGEMSSFFKSNENWDQGEEISMMDFNPETGTNALEGVLLQDIFDAPKAKMLFAYDFLNLWTFYLEARRIDEPKTAETYPSVLASLGRTPNKAPEKKIDPKSEDLESNIDDFDDSDFGSSEDWS